MFYPSYDDYMRDIFYFNSLSHPARNCGFNQDGDFLVQNAQAMMPNMYNGSNNIAILNGLYPSIYKIVWPVVQKVISGNNYQFITEELVNVQGDINNKSSENQSQGNNNQTNSQNNCQFNNQSQISQNNQLMKDLIKILVIRELISKNNVRKFPNMIPYYMPPYMVNQSL